MSFQDLGSLGELVAAVATIATLIYLALRLRTSNRLARAEASRAPNSDLNALNAAFGNNPDFQVAMRKVAGERASRTDLGVEERSGIDFHLMSMTNIQEQLAREIRAGVLCADATDFGGAGLFRLPYYRESWPLYPQFMTCAILIRTTYLPGPGN